MSLLDRTVSNRAERSKVQADAGGHLGGRYSASNSPMPTQAMTDGILAAQLCKIGAYEHWTNAPLDAAARRLLRQADVQHLMSIAAEALRQLELRSKNVDAKQSAASIRRRQD